MLMEEAAAAMQRAGFDFDQVIVDRLLVCEGRSGARGEVAWHSDSDFLKRQILDALNEQRGEDATIIGISVISRVDIGPDHDDRWGSDAQANSRESG